MKLLADLGKLEEGGVSLVPTERGSVFDDGDAGEEHESLHLAPVEVARIALGQHLLPHLRP